MKNNIYISSVLEKNLDTQDCFIKLHLLDYVLDCNKTDRQAKMECWC